MWGALLILGVLGASTAGSFALMRWSERRVHGRSELLREIAELCGGEIVGGILHVTMDGIPLTVYVRCAPTDVEAGILGKCRATVTIEQPSRRRFLTTRPCRALVKEDILDVLESVVRDYRDQSTR